MSSSTPLVSLTVPLFRSGRYVPDIIANLEAVEFPDVEIIVSDRHGHDDAVHRIREHFAGDPRFTFAAGRDGMGWVGHLNNLFDRARGRYLRWMPHDDLFPVCDVGRLVTALESDPSAMLAYGPTTATDLDGTVLPELCHSGELPVCPDEPWTLQTSLDFIWKGYCIGSFKGLFRRDRALEEGLRIRRTYQSVHAERGWLFGASLVGRFLRIEDYHYMKRYHPDSTSAGWDQGGKHSLSLGVSMLGYLAKHASTRDFVRGAPDVSLRAAHRAFRQARAVCPPSPDYS